VVPPSRPAVVRPDEGGPQTRIEEITVTARKVSESAQTVPIAITAFDADTIETLNTRDLADFSVLAPALAIARTDVTPGGAVIFMRGVGNSDIEKTQDPGVVVNVDGVDIASMVGSTLDTFELERVEVLRGPQGTLFGRNTIGGTILVRRKRPQGEWGTSGQFTTGSFHRNDYRLSVDTPALGEQLSFKFGLMGRNDNGPYRKHATPAIPGVSLGSSGGRGPEVDRTSFLASALWTPIDGMDWLLTYERARDRGDSQLFLSLAGPGEVPCAVFGACSFPDPDTDLASDWNAACGSTWTRPRSRATGTSVGSRSRRSPAGATPPRT
jgi:iron complex outermembrane receptor protein